MFNYFLLLFHFSCYAIISVSSRAANQSSTVDATLNKCRQENVFDRLRVFTIPVGQGDATVIKCPDIGAQRGEMIFLDQGKRTIGSKNGINYQQFVKFLDDVFGKEWPEDVNNIFLTHPDTDHVGWVQDMINYVRTKNEFIINLHLGDDKQKYIDKGLITNFDGTRVWMAVRKDGCIGNKCDFKCGYYTSYPNQFAECRWVSDSWNNYEAQAVRICHGWMMTLMASNYGYKNPNPSVDAVDDSNMNSMVLKLTPDMSMDAQPPPAPSMIFFGDFENEVSQACERGTWDNRNYDTLIKASEYYTSKKGPVELQYGLMSDALMIPHHGACTNGNGNKKIFEAIFPKNGRPQGYPSRAFAVVSADIETSYRHPRCEVLENLKLTFGTGDKPKDLLCYPAKGRILNTKTFSIKEDSQNVFQTTDKLSGTTVRNHYIMTSIWQKGDVTDNYGKIKMEECSYP